MSDITRRRLLVLLPAAAVAWKYVLAGTPEASPNYEMSEHWWAHVDRLDQVHWLRKLRARMPERRTTFPTATTARGWSATTSKTSRWRIPRWIRPTAARTDFRGQGNRGKEFLRSQAVQSLRGFTLYAGMSGGRNLHHSRWRGAGRPDLLPRMPLLRPGLPLRMPLHQSGNEHRRQVHAVLSPHHQGTDDSVLRGLSDGRAPACRPEESQRSDP